MGVSIIPVTGSAGAAIRGIDLSKTISASDFAAIDSAYAEYGVVYFSGQRISPAEQVAFSRRFELITVTPHIHPEFPEIVIISNILENGRQIGVVDAGQFWHTDVQFLENPSRGSILYAKEVPTSEDGQILGETCFADQAQAYNALSASIKQTIATLKAVHSYSARYEAQKTNRQFAKVLKAPDQGVEATHPVVRRHPVTGKKCLYVSEGYTTEILGMPEDEASDLLKQLTAHATKPEFVYTHKWQTGDVLLWDNCMMQHNATGNYSSDQRRLMHRTTLVGDRPIQA